MTARAAPWLAILLCGALAACAEQPSSGLRDLVSACGDVCQPLRRMLDIDPGPALPLLPKRSLAVVQLPRKKPEPLKATPVAMRPRTARPSAVADLRPAFATQRDAASIARRSVAPGWRALMPGSYAIVAPAFQPWPRSAGGFE